MSTSSPDDNLWQAFVEAKQEMHRRQAEFYQHASDRESVLRAARGPTAGAWQQGTAFDFLNGFTSDVMP